MIVMEEGRVDVQVRMQIRTCGYRHSVQGLIAANQYLAAMRSQYKGDKHALQHRLCCLWLPTRGGLRRARRADDLRAV